MVAKIFFVGNALFDISLPCELKVLQRYGLEPDRNYEATDKHEELFRQVIRNSYSFPSPGGSAANSARIAQWLFDSWGFGKATFVGVIGSDCIGSQFKSFFDSTNVNALLDVRKAAPTGITAALVLPDGSRSLCAKLGAAKMFEPKFFKRGIGRDEMDQSEIIYVEGFFLSYNPDIALDIAKYATSNSKIFALNLSAVYICESHYDSVRRCFMQADFIFGNQMEAEAFATMSHLKYSTIEDCATLIATLPGKPRIIVITQGKDPVIVAVRRSNTCTIARYKVPEVKGIVDTIGCGDAFVGGVLACLLRDKCYTNIFDCGIYCASTIAKLPGCTIPKTPACQSNFKLAKL